MMGDGEQAAVLSVLHDVGLLILELSFYLFLKTNLNNTESFLEIFQQYILHMCMPFLVVYSLKFLT